MTSRGEGEPGSRPPASLFSSAASKPAKTAVKPAAGVAGGDGGDAIIGTVWRATLVLLCMGALGYDAFVIWRLRSEESPPARPAARVSVSVAPPAGKRLYPIVPFVEVGKSAGLTYVHDNGATGEWLMPEDFTGGCAWFDYDNDGDADALFVNAMPLGGTPSQGARAPLKSALFRNDSGKFTDVSAEAGLQVTMFGMGIAIGDYDGDGWRDVFLSGVGDQRLLRNEKGRFVDVTEPAGLTPARDRWGSSCGFLDYDRDGDLDLFVCSYLNWSRELDLSIDHNFVSEPTYLTPAFFQGSHCVLYQNTGEGGFRNVSEEAGIQVLSKASKLPAAKGLGCVFGDVDGDGWIDIVVANDMVPSFLFHNQQDGTFKEVGAVGGLAFGHTGSPVSGMGVDLCRGGTRTMIGMANLSREPTAMFYSRSDPLTFLDETRQMGVYADSLMMTTWGLFFFDYDLDGRLDMFQANGSVNSEKVSLIEGISYRQGVQLFWNTGDEARKFACVAAEHVHGEGGDPAISLLGRGAAYADYDGDGDLDVLIAQLYGPPALLRNDQKLGHHFVRMRLAGNDKNTDAIGAWVRIVVGGTPQEAQVMPTRSYLSQVEPELTFGLGKREKIDSVQITWPNGAQQQLTEEEVAAIKIDGLTVLKQP